MEEVQWGRRNPVRIEEVHHRMEEIQRRRREPVPMEDVQWRVEEVQRVWKRFNVCGRGPTVYVRSPLAWKRSNMYGRGQWRIEEFWRRKKEVRRPTCSEEVRD
jgi:hypothetical protein